jgi:5-methylcytosine-specific restriction endonuclease McrA
MAGKRTYRERRAYLIEAVRKRRKKVRQMAIDMGGAKCQLCGYHKCAEALEFHHCHNDRKDFSISNSGHSRSWARVKDEIEKCVLLCANCHREVHSGQHTLGEKPIPPSASS